jgi:hypothetical protein
MKHQYPALWHQLSLLGFLWLTTALVAQPLADSLNCDYRLKVASQYIAYYGNASDQMLNEIEASASPCYNGSANALFVEGMLTLYTASDDQAASIAYSLIEQAAKLNHPKAATTLGFLCKEGKGCQLDLEASVDWFEYAYELGDEEAAYALGYYYLKGLGSIRQNYRKAFDWFEKSQYPMAQHWRASCMYYGYGTDANPQEALQTLQEIPTSNSRFLHTQLATDTLQTDWTAQIDTTYVEIAKAFLEGQLDYEYLNVENERLTQAQKGVLLALDWSETEIISGQNLGLKQTYKDALNMDYTLVVNDSLSRTGYGLAYGNEVLYDNFWLELPNRFVGHADNLILDYDIHSIAYYRTEHNGQAYLVGTLDGWVANYNEPTPPLVVVLEDNGLSESEAAGLETQLDFIKTYPNVFRNDLLISFGLDKPSLTGAQLLHYDTMTSLPLLPSQTYEAGQQLIRYDASELPYGLYVIQVQAEDQLHTKLIVKK